MTKKETLLGGGSTVSRLADYLKMKAELEHKAKLEELTIQLEKIKLETRRLALQEAKFQSGAMQQEHVEVDVENVVQEVEWPSLRAQLLDGNLYTWSEAKWACICSCSRPDNGLYVQGWTFFHDDFLLETWQWSVRLQLNVFSWRLSVRDLTLQGSLFLSCQNS